jgi:hypothetical protein
MCCASRPTLIATAAVESAISRAAHRLRPAGFNRETPSRVTWAFDTKALGEKRADLNMRLTDGTREG